MHPCETSTLPFLFAESQADVPSGYDLVPAAYHCDELVAYDGGRVHRP